MIISSQIGLTDRYNLYVLKCASDSVPKMIRLLQQEDIAVLNIGRSLAEHLANRKDSKYIHLEAEEQLKKLIELNAKHVNQGKPQVIAIYNLGILLEPILSVDASKIIRDLSKSIAIIIIWDNINSSDTLHWDTQKDTYQLNFTDTHLKQVNIAYEV